MLVFPNAKINLGLQILRKREDGFHEIASLFYPVPICDALEFVVSDRDEFSKSGIEIPGNGNLVLEAVELLRSIRDVPPIHIHLHKNIPIGAGLGGGSSDAAFMVTGLNSYFELGLSDQQMKNIAAQLGSDCAFFIDNKPAIARGRGEILTPFELSLKGYWMVLHYPEIHISTAEAYARISPNDQRPDLREFLALPLEQWRDHLSNDFEKSLSQKYPVIKGEIANFYETGAEYAAMTGSGSSVFGIYKSKPSISFDRGSTFYFELS